MQKHTIPFAICHANVSRSAGVSFTSSCNSSASVTTLLQCSPFSFGVRWQVMVDAFATLAHYQVRKEKMKINNFPLVCKFRKLTKKLTNLSYPSNSHFWVVRSLGFKARLSGSHRCFYVYANKTRFHKKGFALGLVLKLRVFGTIYYTFTLR